MSQWGMTKMQCLKKHKCVSMRYEIFFAPIQCLKTMHPPKKIHPSQFFSNQSTSINFFKQNVIPSTYHAHAKNKLPSSM